MGNNKQGEKKWLESLFEYEDCDECHRGAEHHTVSDLMGNPFAVCSVAEGCTGHFDGDSLQHDGDSCPVHEKSVDKDAVMREMIDTLKMSAALLRQILDIPDGGYCDVEGFDIKSLRKIDLTIRRAENRMEG